MDIDFPEGMSKQEIGGMVQISRYLLPNTNVIGFSEDKVNKSMNVKQIAEKLNLSERQTYRFLKHMGEIGMIRKLTIKEKGEQEVQYVVNPIHFLNGRYVNDTLYWIFQEELDVYLPARVRDWYRTRRYKDCDS